MKAVLSAPTWRLWNLREGVAAYVCGHPDVADERRWASGLTLALSGGRHDEIKRLLSIPPGNFAVVAMSGAALLAAVDRIRSYPLFYSEANNSHFVECVSDDPEMLHPAAPACGVTNEGPLDLRQLDFLLAGYVTGAATLYPNVLQLLAGTHLVRFDRGQGTCALASHTTWSHISNGVEDADYWCRRLDEILQSDVERLLNRAGGRQVVVPLTGGLDSRILAVMVSKSGYDNVTTYTYGRSTSTERRVAQRVAASLGLPWKHIQYNNQIWRKYRNESGVLGQLASESKGAAAVHIQDRPALLQLLREDLISSDAIVLPGHTGDFISGGHLPAHLRAGDLADRGGLARAILSKHYALYDWRTCLPWLAEMLEERVLAGIEEDIATAEDFAGAFERWELQERQAKYIVNSVRSLEHAGLAWDLPLWSPGMLQLWSEVPLSLRVDARLWDHYVTSRYAKAANLPLPQARTTDKTTLLQTLKRTGRSSLAEPRLRQIYRLGQRRLNYAVDPLASFGIMSWREFADFYGPSAMDEVTGPDELTPQTFSRRCVPRMSIVPWMAWQTHKAVLAGAGVDHREV